MLTSHKALEMHCVVSITPDILYVCMCSLNNQIDSFFIGPQRTLVMDP